MWLTPTANTTSTLHGNNTYYDEDTIVSHSNRSSFSHIPTTAATFPGPFDLDASLDIDSEIRSQASTDSSPPSHLGFSPLSAFDSLPVSRAATAHQGVLFQLSAPAAHPQHLLAPSNMMFTDTWPADAAQFAMKANNGRGLHHRDSSLSSLGSMGPASPFSFSSSNPQIAVNDTSEPFTGLPMQDDQSYQLAAKVPNSVSHDTFYTNYPFGDATSVQSYTSILAPQRHRGDRNGLLPPPDFPSGGSTNSRPGSVASSVASDSPATPAAPEPEEERRRKNGVPAVPKLDRTMTDIFSDELYNPNFTITSTSPSQPSQTAVSPTHDLFVQRLQAANNQHLSATQSPNSSGSRGRSPFRQGSPLAPTPSQNFPQSSANMRFNTAQQIREKVKAEQDSAQALRQTMAHSTSTGTPQTISPKDAVIEFSDADNANNFPLFPQQQQQQQRQQQQQPASGFNASQLAKATAQANNFNNSLSLDTSFDHYLTSQLSSGLQMPSQYPFVPKPRQELPSGTSPSFSMTSHAGSSPSVTPDSAASASPKRPSHVAAEGGTYTCTYHGCTQRFETPALLQKHKREGHRQAHGLSSLRRPEGPSGSYFNTQAGPHKCERINPSTGKPCNTIFSRPYDLTRHEDTIHNGRKQKVRCDVCTEEKTFSRADALTRHYRVCHPDLEFPGKHRKRASNN